MVARETPRTLAISATVESPAAYMFRATWIFLGLRLGLRPPHHHRPNRSSCRCPRLAGRLPAGVPLSGGPPDAPTSSLSPVLGSSWRVRGRSRTLRCRSLGGNVAPEQHDAPEVIDHGDLRPETLALTTQHVGVGRAAQRHSLRMPYLATINGHPSSRRWVGHPPHHLNAAGRRVREGKAGIQAN